LRHQETSKPYESDSLSRVIEASQQWRGKSRNSTAEFRNSIIILYL